ncbi:Putative Sec23/Sec24 domain protein [Giardia duodenalis]|uniref:Putative Sec23/Sec24 domain protein n=1 Tax=Giardia intestinalis TaxID=5741 RepID=V6TP29_GIAIN|nr:Putative Sec23/Sec24 domain protein [Giardia intestinalis]
MSRRYPARKYPTQAGAGGTTMATSAPAPVMAVPMIPAVQSQAPPQPIYSGQLHPPVGAPPQQVSAVPPIGVPTSQQQTFTQPSISATLPQPPAGIALPQAAPPQQAINYSEIAGSSIAYPSVNPAALFAPTDHSQPFANSHIVTTPHYVKLTHTALPPSSQDLSNYALPVGMVIEPLGPADSPPPLIDFAAEFNIQPPRCQNCQAFINCYNTFTPDRVSSICCLCGHSTHLDHAYRSSIDFSNPNSIGSNRVELTHEAYEVKATKNYAARANQTLTFRTYVFLIDVSPQAISSGLTSVACEACAEFIKLAITDSTENDRRIMLGIILFNTHLHYIIVKDAARYELYTVPMIDERFIPAPRDIIVSAKARGNALLNALQQVVSVFSQANTVCPPTSNQKETGTTRDVCFGAALDAAYICISTIGGKILYFLSSLPSCGMGSLHASVHKRNGNLLFSSTGSHSKAFESGDIIKQLLTPDAKDSEFYIDLAVRSTINFVSIDAFLCPPAYVNLGTCSSTTSSVAMGGFLDPATLAELSRCTSGRYNYYPDFNGSRDRVRLYSDILDVYQRYSALEACSRIRSSKEIDVAYTYGNIYQRQEGITQLAQYDEQSGYGCEIVYRVKEIHAKTLYIQMSFLYTDEAGLRHIRCVTKPLPIASNAGSVSTARGSSVVLYNSVDINAQVALLAKKLACVMRTNSEVTSSSNSTVMSVGTESTKYENVSGSLSSNQPYHGIIAGLFADLVVCLHNYRSLLNLQLDPLLKFIPEKLSLLPLFVYAMLRTHMMRPVNSKSARLEERVLSMMRIERGNVAATLNVLYPNIYYIHLDEATGQWVASKTRLSAEYMVPGGIYFIEDVHALYIFFHHSISPSTVSLFCKPNSQGAINIAEPLELLPLIDQEDIDSNLSFQNPLDLVSKLAALLREQRNSYLPIFPITAETRLVSAVMNCLIETRQGSQGYADFVRMLGNALGAKAVR